MKHFGLFLENGKASLVDLDTGEILADNDRYLLGWYLRAYENEFTLTLIQGLTNSTPGAIIKKNKKGNKIMTVTRGELVRTRKRLLREMDEYVRNNIADDFIYCDIWAATGVPDGADDSDYQAIAEDEDLWLGCVKTFAKCCGLE